MPLVYDDPKSAALVKYAKHFGSLLPVLKAARDQPTTVEIQVAPQSQLHDLGEWLKTGGKQWIAGLYEPALLYGHDQITMTPGYGENAGYLAHELTHYLDMSEERKHGLRGQLDWFRRAGEDRERLADEPAGLIGEPSERLKLLLGKRAKMLGYGGPSSEQPKKRMPLRMGKRTARTHHDERRRD